MPTSNKNKNVDIKIEYNGKYPTLCSGDLVVILNGVRWEFPRYCMKSGGDVYFDDDNNGKAEKGPWRLDEWPEDFPSEYKDYVLFKINNTIRWGCCGGCI